MLNGLKIFFKNAGKVLVKHSPDILLGVAIFGSCSAVVMAVKATPYAENEISAYLTRKSQEENIDIDDIELTYKDYIKLCWRIYLATGIMLSTSIVAMILSNYVRAKRAGALATAFAISQETLRSYQEEVIKEVGKKKEEKIRDNMAKKQLKEHDKDNSTVILTGGGNYLIYDSFSGRYFRSTIENIRRAENEINATINRDIYASLNDFYDLIGLPNIKAGDKLGWSGNLLKLDYSYQSSDKEHNEEPCMVISFRDFEPYEGFDKLER